MRTNSVQALTLALAILSPAGLAATAQAPAGAAPSATAAPRQSGTVKAVTPKDFVLTSAGGQDFAVTVPATAKILLVPPGSRDLSTAQPGTIGDIAAGDRAIVNGTAGDAGPMLTATRVIVMKSSAIAASHAADEAAWARGMGGIVKSVDPATGVVTVSSGMRTLTINTSPNTVVRRYAGNSVRFEDAVKSTLAEIRPGDQVRARGQRSADGSTLVADEVVTGSFSNFSGVLSGVDPSAGTITLKDLATKHTVTVAVTPSTNVRKLPPNVGQMMASRGQGGDTGGQSAGHAAAPAGAPQQGAGAAGGGAGRPGGGYPHAGGAGADLSRMMNRLPTETLADLKPGDAVMIVASNGGQTGAPTAITLLSGVEQILAAHPSGETTLSPWSLGSEPGEGEAGGGGPGGGAR